MTGRMTFSYVAAGACLDAIGDEGLIDVQNPPAK
jgi:hypothetical protein